MAWALFYFFNSFGATLPWTSCNSTWNVVENCSNGFSGNNTHLQSASQQFFEWELFTSFSTGKVFQFPCICTTYVSPFLCELRWKISGFFYWMHKKFYFCQIWFKMCLGPCLWAHLHSWDDFNFLGAVKCCNIRWWCWTNSTTTCLCIQVVINKMHLCLLSTAQDIPSP